MKAQTITIIGLGRAGVSIGLAVKAKLPMTVVGYDPNPETARAAQDKMKAVDAVEMNLFKAATKADILVIMLPVSELEETFRIIGDGLQSHTLVLDFSGLKGPGLKWARQHLQQGHYVGATPVLAEKWLADGRTNNSAATADLFQESLLCLMPSPYADRKRWRRPLILAWCWGHGRISLMPANMMPWCKARKRCLVLWRRPCSDHCSNLQAGKICCVLPETPLVWLRCRWHDPKILLLWRCTIRKRRCVG
ncbi:MAG: prephenate dehydrogenase/arogenate dehydrogenase family protein [Anaerolineae bacterium]|nr:prephenate dehydrogenase/arogenate dehydrogenase family protein [Anaerolineae bacterium]